MIFGIHQISHWDEIKIPLKNLSFTMGHTAKKKKKMKRQQNALHFHYILYIISFSFFFFNYNISPNKDIKTISKIYINIYIYI